MRVSFIAREVGGGLRRNFTMTVALIVSVAVSLTLFGAQDLLRMLHELAVGINKPPNPEVLLSLQGANRL